MLRRTELEIYSDLKAILVSASEKTQNAIFEDLAIDRSTSNEAINACEGWKKELLLSLNKVSDQVFYSDLAYEQIIEVFSKMIGILYKGLPKEYMDGCDLFANELRPLQENLYKTNQVKIQELLRLNELIIALNENG